MMTGDQDSDLEDQPPQKKHQLIFQLEICLDNDEDFDENDDNDDDKNYDGDNQNYDDDDDEPVLPWDLPQSSSAASPHRSSSSSPWSSDRGFQKT